MIVATQQRATPDPGDWLPVDEAVWLTGESGRTWRWRAQREAVDAQRRGRRALAMLAGSPNGKGRPTWWVHRSLDMRFQDRNTREGQARAALIFKYPAHKVELAYRKAHWLSQWRKLCDGRRAARVTEATLTERIVAQARHVEGRGFAISLRALQTWKRSYNALGADGQIQGVEGLIDHRGEHPAGGGAHDSRSVAAIEYFYSLYHVQRGPTIKTCHTLTLAKARKEGWTWPASYSATRKWLELNDDRAVTCLFREGRQAWQHKQMAYIQVDWEAIEPGDLFVCDHHQMDLWCEADGKQLRPWFTAIQDCRSRCIVGQCLGVAPHQDLILAGLRRAFGDWAIPRNMRIDNGKDYTSKLLMGFTKAQRNRLRAQLGKDWRRAVESAPHLVECNDPRFQGIVHELGIELIYAIPYAPWSKGTIERFFGTLEDGVSQSFATYCGNSAMHRPECLEDIRRGYTREQKRSLRKRYGRKWKKVAVLKFVDQSAVPTLEQVSTAVGEWIELYHNTGHRGEGMNGRTPLAVWNEATTLRQAQQDELVLLLQSKGIYRVGPNGVRFMAGGKPESYGAAEPRLQRLAGRDVYVTQDPADTSWCLAWTPEKGNRRFIARLESNERISPLATVDELRAANASVQRRRKIGRQADREAAKRRRTVAQELAAHRREKLAELRATGTDGRPRVVNVEPVRTGFEGASIPVRTGCERASRDSGDIWKRLTEFNKQPVPEPPRSPRLSREQLDRFYGLNPSQDDGGEPGTDAHSSDTDLLAMLAETGHGQETDE
ncbi:MAG: DNA-binding domain-containing protein [Phycisphaerae bacterium]